MLDQINNILGKIDNFVWGVPLIVLILLVGIFLTIRLKGLQIRKLPLAVKYLFENEKSSNCIGRRWTGCVILDVDSSTGRNCHKI